MNIFSLWRNGLSWPVILLTYSLGNNIGNLHFVWKVPDEKTAENSFEDTVMLQIYAGIKLCDFGKIMDFNNVCVFNVCVLHDCIIFMLLQCQ